jgi:hypothetical protein
MFGGFKNYWGTGRENQYCVPGILSLEFCRWNSVLPRDSVPALRAAFGG